MHVFDVIAKRLFIVNRIIIRLESSHNICIVWFSLQFCAQVQRLRVIYSPVMRKTLTSDIIMAFS